MSAIYKSICVDLEVKDEGLSVFYRRRAGQTYQIASIWGRLHTLCAWFVEIYVVNVMFICTLRLNVYNIKLQQ